MTRLAQRKDGAWVEVTPPACPSCSIAWRIGPRARFQVGTHICRCPLRSHRTYLCLDCGHEKFDPPLVTDHCTSTTPRLMAPDGGLTEG